MQLDLDQSTRSMKLPLEMYSGDPDAVLGSWVLLERSTVEQMDGESRWALVEREGHAAGPLCDSYRPRTLTLSEFVSVFVLNREHNGCCGA